MTQEFYEELLSYCTVLTTDFLLLLILLQMGIFVFSMSLQLF